MPRCPTSLSALPPGAGLGVEATCEVAPAVVLGPVSLVRRRWVQPRVGLTAATTCGGRLIANGRDVVRCAARVG